MTPPLSGPGEGLNAAVAAVLRAERAAQELTVDEVAAIAEIPSISVRRYLKAQRHIDVSVLSALAEALGTSAQEVVSAAQERMTRDRGVVTEVQFGREPSEGTPSVARVAKTGDVEPGEFE